MRTFRPVAGVDGGGPNDLHGAAMTVRSASPVQASTAYLAGMRSPGSLVPDPAPPRTRDGAAARQGASGLGEAHTRFMERRHFGSLDGLRCLAVLAVVWHHASGQQDGVLGQGHLGVNLFFAISGFLITTLLLREYARDGSISLRKFYMRRSLRIFPAYFAVLGIYVVLVTLTRRDTPEGIAFLDNLPAFATYTSNWFVNLDAGNNVTFYFAWSLATEEQFYLVWPVLLGLLLLRGPAVGVVLACLALAGAVAADQLATEVIDGSQFLITVVRSIATPICLGAALAAILHRPAGFARVGRVLLLRGATPLLAVATLAAAARLPVPLVELLMALLVAACCVREDHPLAPALRLTPVRFIGVVSYGVYLMHMLAVNGVRPLLGHQSGVDVFVAGAAVAVFMAYVSFRFYETPFLNLKSRFASQAPATTALAVARPGHP